MTALLGARIGRWTIVALMAIACVGCSPDVLIEMFNNAGARLSVTACKQEIAVAPAEVIRLGSAYGCSDSVEVRGAGATWRYRLWLPTHNTGETGHYYYHSHWLRPLNDRLTVRLQINADGKVFALPKGMRFPAPGDIPQPLGFPWRPLPSELANHAVDRPAGSHSLAAAGHRER